MALLAGGVYRLAWRREIDRTIALVSGALLLIAAAVLVIANQSLIVRLFTDPTEFTGRTEIWQAEVAFIRDHLLLGAGFGTFSDTGGSPRCTPMSAAGSTEASHGHNGYLQLLVTTGAIGFVLALAALVRRPRSPSGVAAKSR